LAVAELGILVHLSTLTVGWADQSGMPASSESGFCNEMQVKVPRFEPQVSDRN
jgi:hypothetical protein